MASSSDWVEPQQILPPEASYRPARYLLRFDDLCPTHSRAGWARFSEMIEEFALKPMLAIVPDNRDAELEIDPPDPEFWTEMRALEAVGATIALHGFRHLCRSRGRGMVPLHRESEFAGVARDTQREWIAAGLKVLRGHGLNPRVWVAPRHGFDRATLAALRSEGIGVLSDGLARAPFKRHGLIWIPQQLWAPLEKQQGLWTICLHANTAGAREADELRAFLRRHGPQFTSVDEVVAQADWHPQPPLERLLSRVAVLRMRMRRRRNEARSNIM